MQAILVPVKSFDAAKQRLVGTLDDHGRHDLAKELATIVVRARGSAPLYVVCDDNEVADWAILHEATVLWAPELGLSGAVSAGVGFLGAQGFDRVVVAHADLPFVTRLDCFDNTAETDPAHVTIAPDYRLDGTNIISVPTQIPFTFSYGARSYQRHRAQATVRGLVCHAIFDWRLASDIDLPEDLALVGGLLEERGGR